VKDDRAYLEHILECIGWITRFTAGGRDEFLSDRKTQSAVLRELQTLAESTQRLSPDLKLMRDQVPWQGIAGFRNVLAHNYLGIRLERVWEIVERDLPVLRAAATALLEQRDAHRG
jgi:uncharacterized protein with HEPN domain